MGDDVPDFLRFVLLDKQGRRLLNSWQAPLTIKAVSKSGALFTVYSYSVAGYQGVRPADSTSAFPYRFYYKDLVPATESGDQDINDFYLELNGKTDTLHYDVRLTRPNDCFNRYDVAAISFNGEMLTVSTMPGGLPYYVLQRRH